MMRLMTSAGPSVLVLLRASRPADIARFVRAVIVDAVNRVCCGWAIPDVFQEGWKIGAPRRTDRDAAAAVVLEVFRMRVKTATEHAAPCLVFNRARAIAVRVAVRAMRLGAQAAATSGFAVSQFLAAGLTEVTALTFTLPARLFISRQIACAVQDFQSTKTAPRNIYDRHRHMSGVCMTCLP